MGCQQLGIDATHEWYELAERLRDYEWGARYIDDRVVTTTGESISAGKLGAIWSRCIGERWLIIPRRAGAYARLQEAGIVIAGTATSPFLAGGSYCLTELKQEGDRLNVRKSIAIDEEGGFIDSDLKFLREAEVLTSLPDSARGLFPLVTSTGIADGRCYYNSEFFFGYTLGELILQGRISANRVIALLSSLFDNLTVGLYNHHKQSTALSCQEASIQDRVVRRLAFMEHSEDPIALPWKKLLSADPVVINGIEFLGWPSLRHWLLTSNSRIAAALANGPPEWCHGDLIFDDILVSADQESLQLLDPNGDACSRLYDIGKILLSSWSFYEMLKYDQFSCAYDGDDIELHILRDPAVEIIKLVHDALALIWVRAGLWNSSYVEPSGGACLLRNGLHNLGLPMFHLMHHRAIARAIAFFAIGVIRLNQARSALTSEQTLYEASRSFGLEEIVIAS
jgi:hypothetical protein